LDLKFAENDNFGILVFNCKSLLLSVLGFARREEDDNSAPKTRTDDSDHRIRPMQETVTVRLNLNRTGHNMGERDA
jgi:hypothetical protein